MQLVTYEYPKGDIAAGSRVGDIPLTDISVA
jgi:hypothetical protein